MKTSIAIHAIAVTLFGAVMFAPANASAQVNIYIGPGGYSHYGYGYYGYPRYGYYPNYNYGYRFPYYGYGGYAVGRPVYLFAPSAKIITLDRD